MKIFIYKTLFVFVCIFIIFQLTIGMQIKQLNYELEKLRSKENIENIKEKLRDELRNAVSKENKNVIVEQLDITDDEHLQFLKKKYKNEPIDILLNNAAYTPRYLSSFRGINGVEVDATRKSFEVNTIGTMKVIQTFIDNVEESNNGKIVNLSTKAASFEERPEIPMMYSYAMSKAAMNSMVKTLSFETAEKNIIVIAISPGTVNTTLGMGLMGAIDIDESVSKMMVVIDDLTMDHNGLFLDYEDGREIGW